MVYNSKAFVWYDNFFYFVECIEIFNQTQKLLNFFEVCRSRQVENFLYFRRVSHDATLGYNVS